jgi:hypothetical protein
VIVTSAPRVGDLERSRAVRKSQRGRFFVTFEIRVIDVLTISDGRIGAIEVVPDNLSLMTQLDAVRLAK